MAPFEVLVLDGLTVSGDPTATLVLEAFSAPPPNARFDWVSAADSEGAALMRSPGHDNREFTLRIRVAKQATMNAALDQVGALVDKLRKARTRQPDGIAMTYTPADSTRTVTFDVLAGEIKDLPVTWDGEDIGWLARTPVIHVVLSAKPYWRGVEVLSSSTTANLPLVGLEVAGVTGDIDALGRLIVTDAGTQARRHLEWGIENRYYTAGSQLSSGSTPLIIDSDDLATTGFSGAQATRSGAYDPNATGNNVITASLFKQNVVAVCGTGSFAHVGSYRVKARYWSASTESRLRFAWQEGDGPWQHNGWAQNPVGNVWTELDLGTIRIPEKVAGTQRWQGRVEALTTGTSDTVSVDYLLLIPVAEGYGKARGVFQYVPGARTARDEFTGTTAGNALNGRTAPAGGTWGTTGAATDFAFADFPTGEESVQRSTVSDSAPGRVAVLGTAVTNTEVGVRAFYAANPDPPNIEEVPDETRMAVVARYVDISNFLMGALDANTFTLYKRIAGTNTVLAQTQFARQRQMAYSLRMVAYTSGFCAAFVLDAYSNVIAMVQARDASVATGGTLASGQAGFLDRNPTTNVGARYYYYYYAATPTAEPIVVHSGRSLEVRHNDTIRQDSTGVYYGTVRPYYGSRFLVPPGTSRVAVKARSGDVETAEDDAGASLTLQVGWTPRGIAVPR